MLEPQNFKICFYMEKILSTALINSMEREKKVHAPTEITQNSNDDFYVV